MKSKNLRQVFVFTLLIGIALSQPLVLTSAATLSSTSTSLRGSVAGGTKLIISGTGFTNDFSQIQVYVGSFPCIL